MSSEIISNLKQQFLSITKFEDNEDTSSIISAIVKALVKKQHTIVVGNDKYCDIYYRKLKGLSKEMVIRVIEEFILMMNFDYYDSVNMKFLNKDKFISKITVTYKN